MKMKYKIWTIVELLRRLQYSVMRHLIVVYSNAPISYVEPCGRISPL